MSRSAFDADFLAWLRNSAAVDEAANLARAVALAERIPTREMNAYVTSPRDFGSLPRAHKVYRTARFLQHVAALTSWARQRTGA